MDNILEYVSIIKTLGVDEKWLDSNISKLIPTLETIKNVDELNSGIAYAEGKNISLVSPMATLERFNLVNSIEKSLTDSVDNGVRRAA